MLLIILHIIAMYVTIKVILRINNNGNPCNTIPTNGNFCPIICLSRLQEVINGYVYTLQRRPIILLHY